MILQDRDLRIFECFARYFLLTSRQVRTLCFPDDKTGQACRRRLTMLMRAGYLKKRAMQVVSANDGSASPVYHLTKHGLETLAGHLDDKTLLRKPLEPSQPQHLHHYIAVSEMQMLLDRAVARNAGVVTMPRWVHEDERLNPADPDDKRRLRTDFEIPKKIACLPDAAFVLEYAGSKVVVYLEQDRDTFFHDRVAARKSPGYREMLATQSHRRQFPDTTLEFFFVLVITPTRRRAEQLRQSFADKNADQDVRKTYRFGSLDELTDENVLFEPMFICCHHDDRVPLVKKLISESATGTTT